MPDGTKPIPEPLLTKLSVRYGGIHLRVISQEMLKIFISDTNLKIKLLIWDRDQLSGEKSLFVAMLNEYVVVIRLQWVNVLANMSVVVSRDLMLWFFFAEEHSCN